MTVGAVDMDGMRMQARALAFHWLAARDFNPSADGHAWFLLRAGDFGLREDSMKGLRIKVEMTFEEDKP